MKIIEKLKKCQLNRKHAKWVREMKNFSEDLDERIAEAERGC